MLGVFPYPCMPLVHCSVMWAHDSRAAELMNLFGMAHANKPTANTVAVECKHRLARDFDGYGHVVWTCVIEQCDEV